MTQSWDSWELRPPRGEDLPCDDGEPMETERHRRQMNLLVDSLELAWHDRDDFYAAGDMGLFFSQTQALHNDFRAPDVFVVLDTRRHERKRWVMWEEDGRAPDVVIEITSPSAEHVDRGKKKDIYARLLRVPFYAIYDPFSARLDAFALDAARRAYVPLAPDPRGFVRCAPLGLWLGVVPAQHHGAEVPWLRWVDDEGRMLPTANESAHEAEAKAHEAEAKAHEAEAKAHEAERRAREAEAELARLREELSRRSG
jgi:Uma2 family endonuclease